MGTRELLPQVIVLSLQPSASPGCGPTAAMD
jgi:hypothetical protein